MNASMWEDENGCIARTHRSLKVPSEMMLYLSALQERLGQDRDNPFKSEREIRKLQPQPQPQPQPQSQSHSTLMNARCV